MTFSSTALERFWAKIAKGAPDACWVWQASVDDCGYGTFHLNGKTRKVHRVAWEVANGPIPFGMHVLHHCDIRNCCNPAHLFLGTHQDNMTDMAQKGRAGPPAGEKAYLAKMTNRMALEVIELRSAGWSQEKIAAKMGVSQVAISSLLRGKSWGTITGIKRGK